ncbi:MAG: hydrogenase maturation nickel metallochaperone HypA [Desulfobacterales bacterium]|nr:hydrogenase maturation nickel metallochaperone HypA [Desulfobacterales bacterium]MCP4162307.1 hydrogenase maturation nickel metallochaperone HypA [Deltaproteobacteria bacterium]
MHEMGIAAEIIKIAESSIPEDFDGAVEKVNMRIGKMSSVVPESLKFCFDIASEDTRLKGADFVIEEIPVVFLCKECEKETEADGPQFSCKECGGKKIEIISGKELEITSIELED